MVVVKMKDVSLKLIFLCLKAQSQLPLVATVSNLQFSVDPLRYPTFCVRIASHKSFVRPTGQLTRS
jgi:hypothetical protein